MNIQIKKVDPKKSLLRHMIRYHRYMRRVTYDYDLYEIHENNNITNNPIGYITKHKIPGKHDSIYMDIFIREEFRDCGYGSASLDYFINYITEENNIMIICEDLAKSKFLMKNGFIKDKVFIYKNLYKYEKRCDNNE